VRPASGDYPHAGHPGLGLGHPYQVDVTERAVLTAIAGYTARAIDRARYLDQRITVATQLQRAMLTDLPVVSGLQLGALYRPAAAGELVGGDHPDHGPAAAVTAVENACAALDLDATGTLVHAHLSPAGGGAWRLSWTNAGHPPPLLLERPGGRPERLAHMIRCCGPA
jgi:hypothetical protein